MVINFHQITSKKLTMVDLFSGIGGFSLAAHWTGQIETVAFCEKEDFPVRVLNKNFPGIPVYDDVKNFPTERVEKENGAIDIVCGGFPCQGFSVAGKQKGTSDDRYLWPEMFDIIKRLRPTWVVAENVTGIIRLALDEVLFNLEDEGYAARTFVLPACGVNAQHKRERVWVVAYSERNGQLKSKKARGNNKAESKESTRENNFIDTEGAGCIWEPAPHSDKQRTQIQAKGKQSGFQMLRSPSEETRRQIKSRVRRGFDGISTGLDVSGINPLCDGSLKDRAKRVKALGNAIVPHVVYPIFEGIVQIEKHK